MDLAGWALYALTAAAALAMVGYLYGRRELPGRGRRILGGLRWAALAILLLLLFDPEFSVPGLTGHNDRVQVLVDGSLSMAAPLRAGESAMRWDAAVTEARRVAGGGEVIVFGDAPRVVAADSLAGWVPAAATSRLAPALRAAAESGARRVVVLTDGGIDDLPEVNRLLPHVGLDLEVRSLGGEELGNRALTEVEAPGWAEAGKPFEVRVGVSASGGAGDSVRVVLRQGDEVLAEEMVALQQAGRIESVVLSFTPEAPEEGGVVRYDLMLDPGDAVLDDDRRSIYVFVDEKPAGVAIVSFRPDWELRFLQPVLGEALGLPVQGYLQASSGRFLRLGSGGEAGLSVGEAEVRRSLERASIVVVHGLDASSPAWAREAVRGARRSLVFPGGGDLTGLPVAVTSAESGDWIASSEVPASPVAELLSEIRLDGLPPLAAVRRVELGAGAWAPLRGRRDRGGGAGVPLVAGIEREGQRTVVALADGFWRWALQDGVGRQAYRRLWSALGGWLLEDDRMWDDGPLRPLNRVAARGTALRWVAAAGVGPSASRGGEAGSGVDSVGVGRDSVALRVMDAAGVVAVDTTVGVLAGDTIALPALPPGHYSYEVRALAAAGGSPVGAAGGEYGGALTVESYSPEYMRAPVPIADVAAAVAEGMPARRSGPGNPLHTEPWPYLAFVLLVSTEWIFRRRWGLR
jgi:hypothetical protein